MSAPNFFSRKARTSSCAALATWIPRVLLITAGTLSKSWRLRRGWRGAFVRGKLPAAPKWQQG
jgi:hypothetical protein